MHFLLSPSAASIPNLENTSSTTTVSEIPSATYLARPGERETLFYIRYIYSHISIAVAIFNAEYIYYIYIVSSSPRTGRHCSPFPYEVIWEADRGRPNKPKEHIVDLMVKPVQAFTIAPDIYN